jgi:uncharacterized membrane-anchored protein YhcB (DUF1043 family)
MGNDPWLTIGIALIAALAALAGALIAAVTAAKRQQQQLAHDAQRQQAELQHNRKQAELSELRSVLDDASRDITTAERVMLDATEGWIQEGAASDELQAAMASSFDAMWGSAQRILLRLGPDEVREAYWKATLIHQRLGGQMARDATSDDRLARIKELDDPKFEFLKQRDAFFEAAHDKYGAKGLSGD